ncbi:hypothetical protein LTR37_005667 [Vermiconidia calcicola]|uniref:Uncharacterized protein n=1 Tax=Vermiconidia calcicola TaxID=1690605 RepID=A0ACC3NIV4_9PEZI|nr:hypothetical protein LTR37_005667 [Vermiconidia calcicola]
MAPATKKRKTIDTTPKFHCFSCATDRKSTQFPDYNPSADCDHLINTCKTCLKKWVQSNVESANLVTGGDDGKVYGVHCPQCKAIMGNVNVKIAATKKVYERFEELERKHIGDATPDWRWCLNPTCKAGQVHESKAIDVPPFKRQKRGSFFRRSVPVPTAEPDICTCNECGAKACVTCDRPWHDGETCSQYQLRIKDRMEEEDKALREIRKVTKKCPKCQKPIQKNGGCPSMHCSQCSTNFCWNCETVFALNGCKCSRR